MTRHEQLLEDLFACSANVSLYNPPLDQIDRGRSSITWEFAGVDLPRTITDYLFDHKLKTNSWKANLKYVRRPNNKPDFLKLEGKITYIPSGKKYWDQVYTKFEEWDNKRKIKSGNFFEIKSSGSPKLEMDIPESMKFFEHMKNEILTNYTSGPIIDMSNIRPKGDSLDAFRFVATNAADKDKFYANPCAEIKMTEPQTCTLGLSDIKQSNIRILEVTPNMKMQNKMIITSPAGKIEFDMDGTNTVESVYAATQHCVERLNKLRERRESYLEAGDEVGVTMPTSVMVAIEKEESEIAAILESLGEVPTE